MNRVLVIDDEVGVLNHLMVLLAQSQQYEVETLSDSRKAFEVIAAGHFDALLLDMAMPGVSGLEVLRYVRAQHPEIGVVVISGVEDIRLAVESMKLGAQDYLVKPVEERDLFEALARAVSPRADVDGNQEPGGGGRPEPLGRSGAAKMQGQAS
jgi:DNA-binding NtrC family response regulator